MTTQSVFIRLAAVGDIDALVELARTTFTDAYKNFDKPSDIDDYVTTHFTPDSFASILQDSLSTLLVAQLEETLIGYTHIRRTKVPAYVTGASPIELVRLYLRQESIGKGHGVALMRAALDVARRAGCETIWLSVYDKNVRAVMFYEQWGFVNVGTKSFLFGGKSYDDPVMAANVPSLNLSGS